jgi:formylglycine-generating enzyme required for sulfatase activity
MMNEDRKSNDSVVAVSANIPLQSQPTGERGADPERRQKKEGRRRNPPLRILFLGANPTNTSRLKLGHEVSAIERTIRSARIHIELQQSWEIGTAELQDSLLRHKPDIVHLSAHGSPGGRLMLEEDALRKVTMSNASAPVVAPFEEESVRALGRLFGAARERIRCVVLNACYSEAQARAIAEHIDYVIGMTDAIRDDSAIRFARAFYNAIGYSQSFRTAFDLGCAQIGIESPHEQNIPIFFGKNEPFDDWQDSFIDFERKFPDVRKAQDHFEREELSPRQHASRYFSDSPIVRIRHHPILFRSISDGPSTGASIDHIVQAIRSDGGRREPVIVMTDFVGDLSETIWALVRKIHESDKVAGKLHRSPRWTCGTNLLSQARDEQLGLVLNGPPSLLVADFSDLQLDDILKPATGSAMELACTSLLRFAQQAGHRGHRALVGFPRFLLASEPARRFVHGSLLAYDSDELFAPGHGFRPLWLQEVLQVGELSKSLQALLSCNSNALSYAVLAFLIDQGKQGWNPKSAEELFSLSERLFRRGFHEIAFRLQIHCQKLQPTKEFLSVSFDLERITGTDSVVGIVDDATDLPRSVIAGALIGDGGSGKTTTLQKIEREWALPVIAAEGEQRASWLPIYCSVTTSGESFWERLSAWWRESSESGANSGLLWEELARWTANGHLRHFFASPLMLLVDGLDEVPPPDADKLSNELSRLRPLHYGILAAARGGEYLAQALGLRATLRPLATKQIQHYMECDSPVQTSDGRTRLLELLNWKDRPVSGLLRNPYLLRCLRELSDAGVEVADLSEGELLDLWLELGRRQRGIGDEQWQRTAESLEKLALDWMERRISREILGAEARERLDLDAARRMGLIDERRSEGDSFVRFAHSKLQAYFAARALRKAWKRNGGATSLKRWLRRNEDLSPLPLLMGLLTSLEQSRLLALVGGIDSSISLTCLRSLPRQTALAIPGARKILEDRMRSLEEGRPDEVGIGLESLCHLDPRVGRGEDDDSFGDRLRVSGISYRLGKYPVTNLDFARFVEEGGYEDSRYWTAVGQMPSPRLRLPKYWLSEGYDRPNGPVVGVCVFEALAYCEWLNMNRAATQGGVYHFGIPTVDQWLWAAHGADPAMRAILLDVREKLARVHGSNRRNNLDLAPELAQLRRRIQPLELLVQFREIETVGLSPYQVSGCFDLYGGIWEWCDEWIVDVNGIDRPSLSAARHPTYVMGGPSAGPFDPTFVLSGGWFDPYLRFERIGFRIVRNEVEREPPGGPLR